MDHLPAYLRKNLAEHERWGTNYRKEDEDMDDYYDETLGRADEPEYEEIEEPVNYDIPSE